MTIECAITLSRRAVSDVDLVRVDGDCRDRCRSCVRRGRVNSERAAAGECDGAFDGHVELHELAGRGCCRRGRRAFLVAPEAGATCFGKLNWDATARVPPLISAA